jgi:hypothetical protein
MLVSALDWIIDCIPTLYPYKARNASLMIFGLDTGLFLIYFFFVLFFLTLCLLGQRKMTCHAVTVLD